MTALPDKGLLLLLLNNFWAVPARLSSEHFTEKRDTALLAARRTGGTGQIRISH